MNTLSLNIVTPNGSVYDREDVELAVLQTTAGEMGIMSGHIPTVAALKLAMLKLTFTMVMNMQQLVMVLLKLDNINYQLSSKQQKLLTKSMLRELNQLSREQNHIQKMMMIIVTLIEPKERQNVLTTVYVWLSLNNNQKGSMA